MSVRLNVNCFYLFILMLNTVATYLEGLFK